MAGSFGYRGVATESKYCCRGILASGTWKSTERTCVGFHWREVWEDTRAGLDSVEFADGELIPLRPNSDAHLLGIRAFAQVGDLAAHSGECQCL